MYMRCCLKPMFPRDAAKHKCVFFTEPSIFRFDILRVLINMDGIRGIVDFAQRSPFDPTWVNFQLGSSDGDYESNLRFVSAMMRYTIRELPPKMVKADQFESLCNTTGTIYNPTGIDLKKVPPPGKYLLET